MPLAVPSRQQGTKGYGSREQEFAIIIKGRTCAWYVMLAPKRRMLVVLNHLRELSGDEMIRHIVRSSHKMHYFSDIVSLQTGDMNKEMGTW